MRFSLASWNFKQEKRRQKQFSTTKKRLKSNPVYEIRLCVDICILNYLIFSERCPGSMQTLFPSIQDWERKLLSKGGIIRTTPILVILFPLRSVRVGRKEERAIAFITNQKYFKRSEKDQSIAYYFFKLTALRCQLHSLNESGQMILREDKNCMQRSILETVFTFKITSWRRPTIAR